MGSRDKYSRQVARGTIQLSKHRHLMPVEMPKAVPSGLQLPLLKQVGQTGLYYICQLTQMSQIPSRI